jgi:uncharacterized protein
MNPTIDMQVSPYDRAPKTATPAVPAGPLLQLGYKPRERWVPSRFNARTVGDDGRLILWNTLSGAVCIFEPHDRERVVERLSHKGVAAPLDQPSEYLAKRGYLVRASVDELVQFRYWYGQQQWRTDALELILLASEDCNFRCVYCYEKFKNGLNERWREGVVTIPRPDEIGR